MCCPEGATFSEPGLGKSVYYYNLACAGAEAGDPKAAHTHLQQAFDRRTNALKGEPFPDPTEDDSSQKLR